MIKHWPKSSPEEGLLIISSYHFPEGSWGKNSKHEPSSRNWSRGHGGVLLSCLLSMACSACVLKQPRDTCPGAALATLHYSVLRQSSVKNLHHRLVYRSILMEVFSQSRFCLLRWLLNNNKKIKKKTPNQLYTTSLERIHFNKCPFLQTLLVFTEEWSASSLETPSLSTWEKWILPKCTVLYKISIGHTHPTTCPPPCYYV